MFGVVADHTAWLNYATSGVMFFAVFLSWGLIERRFRKNGDKPDWRFRAAWAFFLGLAIYIIAWPVPADENWLILRAAIGRSLFVAGLLFIGHMIWTYDRIKHEKRHHEGELRS